jgi:peroxin-12
MGLDIRRARVVIEVCSFTYLLSPGFLTHLLSQAAKPSLGPPANLKDRLMHLFKSAPRLVLDSLRILLPLSIFFVRFLEWWYSPSSPARALSAPPKGPPIPPPRVLMPHPKGKQVDSTNFGECPICREPVQNATAAPSGYVFCYRCIYAHVEKAGKCPVTLVPVNIWQLRKIMA